MSQNLLIYGVLRSINAILVFRTGSLGMVIIPVSGSSWKKSVSYCCLHKEDSC